MTRLLVLGPAFHDYDAAIGAAFEAIGLDVVTHVYDRSATVGAKLRTKLLHELPEHLGRSTTAARARVADAGAIAALRAVRPDLVLVIKGDVLGDAVWDEIDAVGAPSVLWLYDELRRTRWDAARLDRPGRIASYSALDVATLHDGGHDAAHVPLGFDHLLAPSAPRRADEVTFIGALYPQREALLRALDAAGILVRAYGRDWSHHLVDRARTWGRPRPAIPAGRDLPRAAAYAIMAGSAATLNIHGDQDGFTMRTFEASGTGGVQLCDRADVADLYAPGEEIVVFDGAEDLCAQASALLADPVRAARIRRAGRARTLAEHTLVHRARALHDLWETS